MKHLVTFLAFIGMLFSTSLYAQRQVAAYITIDATTGYVLASQKPDRKLQVGSLTKIATAMVVLDWAEVGKHDPNELVTVPPSVTTIPGINPVGLQPGDRLSIRDLTYAALLQSDNMAAEALAEYVGATLPGEGTPVERFVSQMNALARRLGMTRTLFLNPHGLDNAEKKAPYSTAADMARLTKYAMASSGFRFYVSQRERKITINRQGGETVGYLLQNTNELLGTDDIDGVKTGKTVKAGECIVVSAQKAPETRQEGDKHFVTPRRLISVVLGSRARFRDASELLDEGWQKYNAWAAAGRPLKKGQTL